jgi:hypothetical protein
MSLTQGIATTPMAKGAEETLLAGDAGTAALGASGTSATSLATATASAQSILRIHAVSGTWGIHILCSATGFGASDSAIVGLEGATVNDQCVITNGVLAQASGTPLEHAGTDLRVTVQGNKVSGGTSTLTMAIILVHTGGAISLAYPYTLNLNP